MSHLCVLSKLEVHMPKFKMEESYSLQNILPDMGMISIFSNSANLTKLTKKVGLKVSEVSFPYHHNVTACVHVPPSADV